MAMVKVKVRDILFEVGDCCYSNITYNPTTFVLSRHFMLYNIARSVELRGEFLACIYTCIVWWWELSHYCMSLHIMPPWCRAKGCIVTKPWIVAGMVKRPWHFCNWFSGVKWIQRYYPHLSFNITLLSFSLTSSPPKNNHNIGPQEIVELNAVHVVVSQSKSQQRAATWRRTLEMWFCCCMLATSRHTPTITTTTFSLRVPPPIEKQKQILFCVLCHVVVIVRALYILSLATAYPWWELFTSLDSPCLTWSGLVRSDLTWHGAECGLIDLNFQVLKWIEKQVQVSLATTASGCCTIRLCQRRAPTECEMMIGHVTL